MIDAGNPKYRLRGDGTGDQAGPFTQIMADAQATHQMVLLPPGRYQTSYFAGFTGLSLIGESRASTVIALHPSTPEGSIFGVTGDDVVIRGICFDGQSLGPRQDAALVSLIGSRNTLLDCAVRNVPYIGVEMVGRDGKIHGCYFTRTGKPEVTPEGGAAIWIGGSEENPTVGLTVDSCLFEDLEWSSIYSCPQWSPQSDVMISNNRSRRTKESAFFLYGFRRLRVIGNTIEDVTVKNISASGVETGGTVTVENNVIRRTQAQSISLQQGIDGIVRGNDCSGAGGQAITHLSIAFDPESMKVIGPPRNIQIIGNPLDGSDSARIWFGGQSGAAKARSVIIADNTGLSADGGLDLDPSFQGDRFFVSRDLVTDTRDA